MGSTIDWGIKEMGGIMRRILSMIDETQDRFVLY